MNKNFLFFALTVCIISSNTTVLAGSNFVQTQATQTTPVITNNAHLQGHAIYVPAGVTCKIVLTTSISSNDAVVGQIVEGILSENLVYNGRTIAPSGSVISGTITSLTKQNFGARNAKMQIKFTSIRTANGMIPISASIVTNDGADTLKGATTKDSAKEYAKTTAIGAASGAILGTALGPLSGGEVGKGAIYGTVIGSGLGVAATAIKKGEAINIPANSQVTLRFDQPIQI